MLTDTHCHIYAKYYEDIDSVLNKAKENGVNRFINNGSNHEANKEVLELCIKYENMFGALGIHPESASNYALEDLTFIEKNLVNKKVIAIGEIGLDYYWTKDNKEKQIELFEKQLKLANKYDLPVIIHNRDSTDDMIRILKEYKPRGVIHSFCGSYETAMEYIKLGLVLGINGVVTFKNSKLSEVLEKIDPSNIIIETDSPYLTPHPYRGNKNDPSMIKVISEYLSNLYHIDIEKIEEITNNNINRVFDI